MPSQILQIRPESELVFKGPYDHVVTSVLKLRNPTGSIVAFKVKTTAPKRYCVRPNSGLVQPNSEVEVAVMLQPFEYDPTDKSRHKFMVQSLVAKDSAVESLDDLWKTATSDNLMDSKLKVVLEPGADEATVAPVKAVEQQQQPPVSASAPQQSSAPAAGGSESGSVGVKKLQQQQQLGTAAGNSPAAQRKSASGYDASQTSQHSAGKDQQQQQGGDALRNLQMEIQRLKDENSRLSEQELRLRKLAMRDTKSSDVPGAGQQLQQQQLQSSSSASQFPPVLFLVLALVLGLLVGKFIL